MTSCSRSLNSAKPRSRCARSRRAPIAAALAESACSMRSTSALFENGFSTKSNAPRLTAAHRGRHVAVAGQEDDRQRRRQPALDQALEQREAAHAVHAQIEQQARRRRRPFVRPLRRRRRGERGLERLRAAMPLRSRRRERSSQAIASRTTSSSSTR